VDYCATPTLLRRYNGDGRAPGKKAVVKSRSQTGSRSILLFSLFLLFCLRSPFLPAQSNAPDTAFGLQIGGALSLPECERIRVSKNNFAYRPIAQSWCYERMERGDTPLTNGTIEIKFPLKDRPQIVSGLSLIGTVMDGRLEGIGFNTLGVSNADDVLQKLTEKYGKPTSSEPYEVQNGFGAKFTSVRALWSFSNLVVIFKGVSSNLDSGLVIIETPKCNAWREQKLKELTNGRQL